MLAALAGAVATPVLDLSRRGRILGRVLGGPPRSRYVAFGGTVVAVTWPGVPLTPTAVQVGAPLPPTRPGVQAELRPGLLRIGGMTVTWDPGSPPAWDPYIAIPQPLDPRRVWARGSRIMIRLAPEASLPRSVTPWPNVAAGQADRGSAWEARQVLGPLFRSVAEGSPEQARRAADNLLGLGPGLTPEGDDYLSGAAAAIHVLRPPWAARWLEAILPADLESRTTALSATLLRLAAAGAFMQPVHPLLDFGTGDRWEVGLSVLLGVGHSTGRAYALSIGAVMSLLGATAAEGGSAGNARETSMGIATSSSGAARAC